MSTPFYSHISAEQACPPHTIPHPCLWFSDMFVWIYIYIYHMTFNSRSWLKLQGAEIKKVSPLCTFKKNIKIMMLNPSWHHNEIWYHLEGVYDFCGVGVGCILTRNTTEAEFPPALSSTISCSRILGYIERMKWAEHQHWCLSAPRDQPSLAPVPVSSLNIKLIQK